MGIRAIGWYVPPGRRTAAELAASYGVPLEALARLGVRSHAVAGDADHPSSMGARAVENACRAARLPVDAIDLLIFAGITRDYPPPWVGAFGVLHHLGTTKPAGFDIAARCPALHDALWVAENLVRTGASGVVAVCCADRFDYLFAPPRPALQASDVTYAAGAAAAIVTADATNDIVAFSHRTNPDLSVHEEQCPRAGGSRVPVTHAAVDAGLHRSCNTMTLPQAKAMREFHEAADRDNFHAVCRKAGFDAVDFVAGSPIDVNAFLAAMRAVGVDESRTLSTLPVLGHLGPADALLALGMAMRKRGRIGERVVMITRSSVYASALALRGHGGDVGIAVEGDDVAL
jgi:3-oxoacyl-[acyl-carrier-protein] synthase III